MLITLHALPHISLGVSCESVIPSSVPPPYSPIQHVAVAFTCRIPSAQRRIALSPLPESDQWRVLVSELPHAIPDGSASIKLERIQGLASACERLSVRLCECATVDAERFYQSLVQSFITWAYGRPGIRPRSAPGRERMIQQADRYLECCQQYVRAAELISAHATALGVNVTLHALPGWAQSTKDDLTAGKTLVSRREQLLQAVSAGFRRPSDPPAH